MRKAVAAKAAASKAVATKAAASKAVATKATAQKAVATKAPTRKARLAVMMNGRIRRHTTVASVGTTKRMAC